MSAVRFSSEDFPGRDRKSAIQDLYASIEQLEIEPIGEETLFAEASIRFFPALTIVEASCSSCISRRTASHVADGKDDLTLCILTSGVMAYSPAGVEAEIYHPGEAYLGFSQRTSEHRFGDGVSWIDIAVPRAVLAPRLADLDSALKRKLPPSAALRLLTGYARALNHESENLPPRETCLSAGHVIDLAATAVGASRELAECAGKRGVAAARLIAAKADLAVNLARPDLSAELVAARIGISPQYLRALFNAEGTTFGIYVLEQRLAYARRLLADPSFSGLRISAIAFEAGFSDLSYFNRTFRRRYSMRPSDARAAGLERLQ